MSAEIKVKAVRILGEPLFHGGAIAASRGIAIAYQQDPQTLHPFLDRHFCGDWGDLDEEDKEANDEALFNGSRILSAYHVPSSMTPLRVEMKIWIITEAENDEGQRTNTTVLFPNEY